MDSTKERKIKIGRLRNVDVKKNKNSWTPNMLNEKVLRRVNEMRILQETLKEDIKELFRTLAAQGLHTNVCS